MNTYKVLKDCFIKRVLHKKGQEIKLSEQEAKQYVERRVLKLTSKLTENATEETAKETKNNQKVSKKTHDEYRNR